MNRKTKSLLALLLAGVMLVGATACSKKNGDTAQQSDTTGIDPVANPEHYITLPEISSISVSRSEIEEMVDQQIESMLDNNYYENFEVVEEAAKLGDSLNIDYEGRAADENVTLSEQTLAGMKGDYDLVLGSNSFIGAYYDENGMMVTASFEDQLVGMKAGETKDITVTFPDNYSNDEIKGKKVIFTVSVHTVSRLTVAENSVVSVGYVFAFESSGNTEEDEAFQKLFANSKFKIDYSAEIDNEATFNEVFKVADYRDLFMGKNKYDRVEKRLTIPEGAEGDFADFVGREVLVAFVIDSSTVRPEWNDDFANKYTSGTHTTVAAFREDITEDCIIRTAYDKLYSAVKVNEYPTDQTNVLYLQKIADAIAQKSGQSVEGMSMDEMKALVDEATYESICNDAKKQAEEAVKELLFHEYLFKTLEITLSEDEYKQELQASYENYVNNYMYYYYIYYGVMFETAEEMETYYGKESLQRQFKLNKVYDLLPDMVTMVD